MAQAPRAPFVQAYANWRVRLIKSIFLVCPSVDIEKRYGNASAEKTMRFK